MKTSGSGFGLAFSSLAWLGATFLLLMIFTERLYSQSADIGHHGILVSYLMDSWHVVPDAVLDFMARYPRLAHLLASIPASALDSSLLGMQVISIFAIFMCWACIGVCLLGPQTWGSARLLGSLALVLAINALIFRVETFGHEIVANYFFGHLVAQALAIVLLAVALRSEWKKGTPSRAYAVMAVGGPLLTATHLVPAAEVMATLGLLVVLNLPDELPSREGRRRTLVGLVLLLASCALAVIQPAFGTMVWASAFNGLTLLKYVPDLAYAIGVATVAALASLALLFSWWRRRRDSRDAAIPLKYLGAFGLATSGLCLLQAVLLVGFGIGSDYAVMKYMISLQSLILIDVVVLASLFRKEDGRRLNRMAMVMMPPAFGVIATCAALIPNSSIPTDPIAIAERDARAFARASSRIGEKGENIAVGMTGVPNFGSYLISRSALRAWSRPMLIDLLNGKVPQNTEEVSHILTSPGSVPWDVPRCRIQPSGTLVVLDATCVLESFPELACFGNIEFSAPTLDRYVTGFSYAETMGRWTEQKEATVRCILGESAPKRMLVQASALVTAQHRQHVEYRINGGPIVVAEYSAASPRQVVSIEVPPNAGLELVLLISTPDATSPSQLGLSIDRRTLGVLVQNIRFE